MRAVAAFALGVIGGDEALARLKVMLIDSYPNARYNAATGLARHGDAACVPVLQEMLDPENQHSASDENNDRDKDRKRATVLMNGMRATLICADANPQADLTQAQGVAAVACLSRRSRKSKSTAARFRGRLWKPCDCWKNRERQKRNVDAASVPPR